MAYIAAARLGDVLRPNHLEGPPDLCIEVVSPDEPGRDYVVKFKEYQRVGVKEYWIVNPLGDLMDAYTLKGGKFVKIRKINGRYHSPVLPGLSIDPAWLWKNPMPNVLRVLQEQGVTVEELMAE